jgi:hypothetical protein
LSFLDYARQANVQLTGLTQSVQNIISASGGTVDAKGLADQIVAEFVNKIHNNV